jgi:hypothetical protein
MGNTVYAQGMGFFHKGSGGKGVAPGDVCLSPPPPPTGPAPVPYVNTLKASDLAKGSKTVKIQGNPTALEDVSYLNTSTGDEGGTQGGNVVTHKTKGKGYFKSWSSVVKVEGKGVCVHGGLMGQNCASPPVGAVDPSAIVNFRNKFPVGKPCARHYQRKGSYGPTAAQTAHIWDKPCWVILANGTQCGKPGRTADHQPPLVIAWYRGGCHKSSDFKDWARKNSAVKPQCSDHSMNNPQKGMSSFTRNNPTVREVRARIAAYLK